MPLALTTTELTLLSEFAAASGIALSRDLLLEQVWDYAWSSGTGLGLTIATGQARLLGARPSFRNLPAGGAEAELRLLEARPDGPEDNAPQGP